MKDEMIFENNYQTLIGPGADKHNNKKMKCLVKSYLQIRRTILF